MGVQAGSAARPRVRRPQLFPSESKSLEFMQRLEVIPGKKQTSLTETVPKRFRSRLLTRCETWPRANADGAKLIKQARGLPGLGFFAPERFQRR